MAYKFITWLKNCVKSDDQWYLENSRDIQDLEIRLLTLQREGMRNLYLKYWYGH